MKNTVLALALVGTVACATAAQARNATIEDALKSRSDLSTFYNGLVSTGVIDELKDSTSYTVFAPTNDAFAKISQDKYPCFYSADCKAKVAAVLRRHIVPGEKHVNDVPDEGGVLSLFSIDNQHLSAAEPNKGHFTVDGKNITSENQLIGSELYKIDGLLIADKDLAQFEAPQVIVVHEKGSDLPPPVPEGKVVTVTTTDSTAPVPH